MSKNVRHWAPALAGGVLLLWASAALAAPAPGDEFAVTLTVGWQGHCRAEQWAPMEVIVSSLADKPFIGDFQVSLPQDDQHRLVVHQPLVVPPFQHRRVHVAVKVGFSSDTCRVLLVDRDRGVRYNESFDLFSFRGSGSMAKMVTSDNILVGTAGRGVMRIPVPEELNRSQERVMACSASLPELPYAWVAYSGLDAMVLCDPDWSQINPAQQEALARWVSNGGQLLVLLGGKPVPADSALGRLIPLKVSPPVESPLPDSLQSEWGMKDEKAVTIARWQFSREACPDGWSVLHRDKAGNPLAVAGLAGFGRIVLCAYNPMNMPLNGDKAVETFWMSHLTMVLDAAKLKNIRDLESSNQPRRYYPYGYGLWTISDSATNGILGWLMSIAQLEPISIWWVLGVLGSMALLIGPVDYLVLKRLNRLPWTYVTFLSVLTVYTAGAYFGVQYLRAGQDQLRRLSVMDKIEGTGCAWQTGYTGIFASRSDDYLLAGCAGDSWWSGVTPGQEYPRFGNSGIKSVIECIQQEGNVPVSLPVNIWSMRTLQDEAPAPAFPLTASVAWEGKTPVLTLKNVSAVALQSLALRLGGGWWEIGLLASGQTLAFKADPANKLAVHPLWSRQNSDKDAPYGYGYPQASNTSPWMSLCAKGIWPRTQGIDRLVEAGAAVIYGSAVNPPSPLAIQGKKPTVQHTQHFRLVIPHVQTGANHD